MNCIIVDDEPLAQDILEDYIQKVPFLCLIAKCKNAYEASETLKNNQIDLMFLDIQMPEISGTQFLSGLENKPLVIFTTAYSEYAVEGYELNAADYLLKPISPDRFLQAVNKARDLFNLRHGENNYSGKDYIFVKSEYQTVKIEYKDILYIEGLKDYVKIYTVKGLIMTLMNMKGIYEKLPKNLFIRVHRSYIVPFKSVEKIDRNRILIKDMRIPIGDSYKDDFYKMIGTV